MTLPRRMLEVGPRGTFRYEHNEDPLCTQRGCVPVATPLAPPDARPGSGPGQALRVAAQAVVARWRFGKEKLGKAYGFGMESDLEALEAALQVLGEEEA